MNIRHISHFPSKITHPYVGTHGPCVRERRDRVKSKVIAMTTPDARAVRPYRHMSITELTAQLSASMKRPTRRTLTLIDKALGWLRPFESARTTVTSPYEKQELLQLLRTHRMVLKPYIDVDRIESHLRHF